MDYLSIGNSWPVWLLAVVCVIAVLGQAILFMRLAFRNAKPLGISKKECVKAVKAGAVAAVGPSIANALATLSLVAVVGAPIAWIRLSMIGNAATESGAATVGALAAGTALGSPEYGVQAMSVVWFTMAINGCGWLLMTVLFAHRMEIVRDKVAGGDKLWLGVFQATSMIGIISYSLSSYTTKLDASTVAAIGGFLSCIGLTLLGKKVKSLKEWILGISIFVGLLVGYLFM